ncbi:MAG: TraR/DksA C4-type zinc finger protein [Patescibacteria group bacterium]
MLTKSFIAEMEAALLQEKNKLISELSSFAHRNPQAPGIDFNTTYQSFGEGEDENAAEIAQFGDNLSLEQELESGLKDIDSALKAMEKGVYGTCKYCEQPISQERLKVRPTSTSCVACKKTLTQEV